MGNEKNIVGLEKLFFKGVTDKDGVVSSNDWRRAPRRKAQEAESGKKLEPMLSIAEVAKQTGISRHRIDAAINCGELAFYPFGKTVRKLKVSDVNQWLEDKRTRIGG